MVTIKKDNELFDKVYNEISSGCNKSGRPLTYSEEVLMEITIKALVEEQKKEYDKIFDWIYKNNTIPLKGTIHIASLDGGWINGLKLGDRLRQLKKVLFGDE